VFNRQRVFWEKTWQKVDKRTPSEEDEFVDVDRFLQLLPERAFVIDLGCGDGRHAERIAAAGHHVLGVDYSFEALRVARQTEPENVEYRFLNLNDRHGLLLFALEMIDQGRQPYFFARNLLHVMTPLGRADLFGMLRCLLNAKTLLYATYDATPVPRIQPNPLTWTLRPGLLSVEAWRWKLGTTLIAERLRTTPSGERKNVTALVWL
jgi:2-polyprenyl-3-methyl-5-hydroxy-6-metoxy-1,4-benzoquinol methylase